MHMSMYRPLTASATAACIFKVFDDCRQDALAIQILRALQVPFSQARCGLSLTPYSVIPSRVGSKRAEGGIIQCVSNAKSLDEIGKDGNANLYHYFRKKFGRVDGPAFEEARRQFAGSMAGYAVATYLLWVKDRHNGNIMVDGTGRLIHIDFGFLLGISPGGNLGFEQAPFKLTSDMVQILGGDPGTDLYQCFQEQCGRAFLSARETMPAIEALVGGMADSGLPCYHFPDTMGKLHQRFAPDAGPREAAKVWRGKVEESRVSSTTELYDGFQKLTQGIHSSAWQ